MVYSNWGSRAVLCFGCRRAPGQSCLVLELDSIRPSHLSSTHLGALTFKMVVLANWVWLVEIRSECANCRGAADARACGELVRCIVQSDSGTRSRSGSRGRRGSRGSPARSSSLVIKISANVFSFRILGTAGQYRCIDAYHVL